MATVPLNTGSFYLYRARFTAITNGETEFSSNKPRLCLAMTLNGDARLPPLAFPITTTCYEQSINIKVWKEELCAHKDSLLVVSQVCPLPNQVTLKQHCDPDPKNRTAAIPPPVLTPALVTELRKNLRELLRESELIDWGELCFQQGTFVTFNNTSNGRNILGIVISTNIRNRDLPGRIVVPVIQNMDILWHLMCYIDLQSLNYGDPPRKSQIPFASMFAMLNV